MSKEQSFDKTQDKRAKSKEQKHIVIDARIRRASTGRYIDRLLEHLQVIDQTNRYTILLEPGDDWRPSPPNYRVVPIRYKQFSFNPLGQIGFAWRLYRLKPDLVHFAMTQQPILYFGLIVTTTHDLTMFDYAGAGRLPGWLHGLRLVGYRFLFWWGHRKSRRIIVPSQYVARALVKRQRFTKSKIAVTYEAAEKIVSSGKGVVDRVSRPFILHVGSPFPHKNIQRLVDAFARLKAYSPALSLVLAGKPEYYFDQLKTDLDDSPAKDSVIFPGRVSDGELKWLYETAEAYVLPSLSEGFGLPGLEAMAHGCPLVSSNATCLPEIYGDAAIYFDPLSVEDMAHGINKVLSDKKLRQKLIERGHKQAAKYSWRKMAKETLAVYRKVLEE